ncbi:hypothetical protein NQZ68_019837 [Dissostichus eleginoides]|nr:hypothetical protein NQZ68_019837 [Dissostichus eleginoides]
MSFLVSEKQSASVEQGHHRLPARHLQRRVAGDGALLLSVAIKVQRDTPMTCEHPPWKLVESQADVITSAYKLELDFVPALMQV